MTAEQLLKLVDKFDWAAYHESTEKVLRKAFGEMIAIQGRRGAALAGGAFDIDDPFIQKALTTYVGERIVQLDDVTKENVSGLLRTAFERGGTVADFGDQIAEKVRERFDGFADWRADRIARTESAIAYNHGNVFGYRQNGVEKVQVLDGDDDEECRRVNGQIWTLEEALNNPVAHPNCERDFAPVVE